MVATFCGACLIPMWVLPSNWGTLTAGAFLIQFMVQGAWGVVPIHLQELSPPQFRSSFPGIAYQVSRRDSSPLPPSLKISAYLFFKKNKKSSETWFQHQRPKFPRRFLKIGLSTLMDKNARTTHVLRLL